MQTIDSPIRSTNAGPAPIPAVAAAAAPVAPVASAAVASAAVASAPVASAAVASAPAPVASAAAAQPKTPEQQQQKQQTEGVIKVTNGWKTKHEEGFIYVSVKGNAKERGMAHGQLLADRIIKFIRTYAYYVYDHTGYDIHLFIEMMADLFMSKSSLDEKYKEIVEEIQGIADGVIKAIQDGIISKETKDVIDLTNPAAPRIKLTPESFQLGYGSSPSSDKQFVNIDAKAIFLLNGIVSLFYIFPYLEKLLNTSEYSELKKKPVYAEFLSHESFNASATSASKELSIIDKFLGKGGGDKCSAFMAVGPKHTKDGGIVYAHITFDDFMSGQFDNIILHLQTATTDKPSAVSADILMQTFPGGIFSSTDFFITTHGFMGTETTIGGFDSFELKAPICFRARKAMQYGKTLEDYVAYFTEHNSGDYANTWYIGRVKKTETDPPEEIMRIELGRRFINVERKTDGYFIGFNACYDPRIRNIECSNDGFYDSRRHSGARRIRLEEIMLESIARGVKIDEDIAIKIISDHKDVYLNKDDNPCSRTICAHYDNDKREYMSDSTRPKPNQPRGAVDAKIGSSKLYKNKQFLAIWGRACGTPFIVEDFCKKHIQWANQKKYLEDRKENAWVTCSSILADKDSDASNALKIYKKSVYTSKDSNIFSASGVAASSVASPSSVSSSSPPPVSPPAVATSAPAPAAAVSTPSTPYNTAEPPSSSKMSQSPSQLRPAQSQSDSPIKQPDFREDDDDELSGGKYNKKDMKNFMKMLKNKNKKSTKQVIKNRNTKKNKQV
jgi:hypothetical protein